MIELLESFAVNIPNQITDKEIVPFIEHQLKTHYPVPELLIYDYVITGKKSDRSVLVTYILKNDFEENREILHPHLLIKHRVIKDGTYLFTTQGHELLIKIRTGKVIYIISDSEDIDKHRDDNITIITDTKLHKLYKKCKKDLFLRMKKRVNIKPLIIFIVILLTFIPIKVLLDKNSESKYYLNQLQVEYNKLLAESNDQTDEEILYDVTNKEILKMESHITPSTYRVLSELSYTTTRVIIKDISISGERINLTVLTDNSLELLKELNRSSILDMVLTNTIPGDNMELSQFSGEIICP